MNSENNSENEETNLSNDNQETEGGSEQSEQSEQQSERADPFANLELPPPVGSDDEWSEDDQHSEAASEDHSALGAAMRGFGGSDEPKRASRPKIPSLSLFGEDATGDGGGFGDLGGFDGGLDSFNDPTVAQLDDAPFLGGRGSGGDLFGNRAAGPVGRATSPKLFAQASQFPTCHQLRCWKWENGIPVGLGVIDAQATEEDFVEQFYDAMPRPTQGKGQFKLRPIDINGQEMGQEITLLISEHHAALKRIRDAKEYESNNSGNDLFSNYNGGFGAEDPTSTMANQMSAAYDRMFQMTEKKQDSLERSLAMERDRMRDAEREMAQERIDLATNTAQGIQVLTERMMNDESKRAERALESQNEQSQMLISTLTSIFSQQQTMMSQYQEQQRMADQQRVDQERMRAAREREELEERRKREVEEYDRRRRREEQEFENKWRLAEEQRKTDREVLQAQIEREKEEMRERSKSDSERLRTDIEHMRLRMEQDRLQAEAKMQREREEYQLRMRHEKEDAERRERERKEEIKRQEETRKQEFELRQKQMEMQAQRDREHQERLMQMSMMERETQRENMQRREQLERESRASAEVERKRQHELMMKEMELSRERDREHNQKILELTKMEIASKSEDSFAGMLPKITGMLSSIGLEPQEVIQRALGIGGGAGDDDDESGESGGGLLGKLPDMLGAAGDIAKVVMAARGMGALGGMPNPATAPSYTPPPPPPRPRRRQPQTPPMIQQNNTMPEMQAQRQPQRAQAPAPGADGVVRMAPGTFDAAPAQPEPIITPPPKPSFSLPLGEQKTARIAARNLVATLQQAEKHQWQEILTVKLMESPVVLAYIMESSVYYTVTEGGASDEFAREFIAELQTSGLVPAEIPMGV